MADRRDTAKARTAGRLAKLASALVGGICACHSGLSTGHQDAPSTSETRRSVPDALPELRDSPVDDLAGPTSDGPAADDRAAEPDLPMVADAEGIDGPGVDLCTPLACAMSGRQYCGLIDDGCGGCVDCRACSRSGYYCGTGLLCWPDADCVPLQTCAYEDTTWCGRIGDACLGEMSCSEQCPIPGWICRDHMCIGPEGVCSPGSCTGPAGELYCGTIGDGCGGTLGCGDTCSPTGRICAYNLCVPPRDVCMPRTCQLSDGRQFCGLIGDGCAGVLDCGACIDGGACPFSHVCGERADASPDPLPAPRPPPFPPLLPPLPPPPPARPCPT
jgi:hypothetical protein